MTALTDGDLSTQTHNGNDSSDYQFCAKTPCYDICILDESIELDHIIIYPPQNTWRYYGTTDLTIQIFTDYLLENTFKENEQYVFYENRMPIYVIQQ